MMHSTQSVLALLISGVLLSSAREHPRLRNLQEDSAPSCKPLTTVTDFDLASYVSSPWFVQEQSITEFSPPEWNYCAKAEYALRDRPSWIYNYDVNVENFAVDKDGNEFGGPLCADIVDETSGKLRVAPCLVPPFLAGPYWVVAYDETAGYALVSAGQPEIPTVDGLCRTNDDTNNSGLWIFTRSPERNDTLIEEVRSLAVDAGLDVDVLLPVNHTGCWDEGGEYIGGDDTDVVDDEEPCKKLTTVDDFDLEAYTSKPWYVHQQAVTRYSPIEWNFCTKAEYVLRENPTWVWNYEVDVRNYAEDAEGTEYGGPLCADVVDSDNGKLRVAPCAFPPFSAGPYWVVAYDEGEGYALISGGQPTIPSGNNDGLCKTSDGRNNSGLWIFSRSLERDEDMIKRVRDIAVEAGLDVSVLNDVSQVGCCKDSPNTFPVTGLLGNQNERDCEWVDGLKLTRCPRFSSWCPETCGRCPSEN